MIPHLSSICYGFLANEGLSGGWEVSLRTVMAIEEA